MDGESYYAKIDELSNTILHRRAILGELRKLEEDDNLLRSLYEQNYEGNTPLHIAAKLGDLETVRILVETARKTDVEQNKSLLTMENNEKDTALHEAVRYNHLKVVKLLIEEHPDLASIVNGEGDSPLFMAMDRCFHQVALHILDNAPNCSYQGRNGMNVLHVAAIRSKRRPVPLTAEERHTLQAHLLRWGLFYNRRLLGEFFLLYFGEFCSRRLDIQKTDFGLRVLKKIQALTLEQADDFGWTPLHYAADIDNEKLVKEFLKEGSERLPFLKNKDGMSALHIAAKKGHDAIIRVLMDSCPDVCELLDKHGRIAFHIAVESQKEMVVKFFLEEAIRFRDLINLKDNKGNIALHVVATVGHFHILRILTNDSKIDKGATNKDKKTFVNIILSNKELQDNEIITCMHLVQLNMMVTLEIEIVLPLRFEQKVDTRKTNEAESSKEKEKNEIQVEENEEAGRKQLEKPVMVSSDKKKPSKNEGGFANMMEDFNNLNLLVATTIATAAFAAAFAMLGGYNDQGVPILYKSKEFQHFLCFDQMAFVLSSASLLLQLFLTVFGKIFEVTLFPVAWIAYVTLTSLFMMVLAFDHGIKTVIPRTKKHRIFKNDYYITGNGIPILFICIFLYFILISIIQANLRATARRFEPHNSVRSRFTLRS